jgi:hypothetical protein
MSEGPRLAYAQARILARLSRLPAEADWQRLAGARTLSAYLEEARATGLGDWVRGFSGLSQSHELERGCRALARESARMTAEWAPPSWRAAIEWVAWLPSLPLLEHLARGDGVPDWAAMDDQLRGLLDAGGGVDPIGLAAVGLADLVADGDPGAVAARWQAAWRRRWPSCPRQCRRDLDGLARLLQRHLDAFRSGPAAGAWDLREALRDRLYGHLHHHLLRPVALFVYIAILFLDLERLRGALVVRAVFDGDGAR